MRESSIRSSCKKKFYGCTQQIMSLLYLADVFNDFGHVEKIEHGNKLFTFYLTTHIDHLLLEISNKGSLEIIIERG